MSQTPAITTFTNSATVSSPVFVKFSGFFKPNQTGYWTFNLGTSTQNTDDLGILFLGPAGTTQITPSSTFSALSTTLSNTTPILFNHYWQNSDGTYSATMFLTSGLYYPILLYFSQYTGDYYCRFSFFYGTYTPPFTPPFTISLKAYFNLNNSSIETISSTTTVTGLIYKTYNGRTGVYCGGSSYSDSATSFIQNANINTLDLSANIGVSISLWVYPTNITSTNCIMVSISNYVDFWDGFGYALTLSSTQIQLTYKNTQNIYSTFGGYSGSILKTGLTISNNTWYHIVAIFNGTTGNIYLNNANQSASITNTNTTYINALNIASDTNLVSIGTLNIKSKTYSTLSQYINFTGVISQVGIYNTSLTSDHVNSLYTTAPSPSASVNTDLSQYIVDPIPNAPTVSSINIVSSSKNVTVSYTNPTITGGFDISTNYAYFSTSSTMTPVSFSVDIGNTSPYDNTVSSLQINSTYYVAIKTQNKGGYYSPYSTISGPFTITNIPNAPTITSLTITPSTKNVDLSYNNTSTGIITNYLYLSTNSDTTIPADISINVGNINNNYSNIVSNIVYGSVYYATMKSATTGYTSPFSAVYGPYTMLTMSVPGFQWTSYTNKSPYSFAVNALGATSIQLYSATVNFFNISNNPPKITSGKTTSLQTSSTDVSPSITTFTGNAYITEYVGVKFSGFFIPNQSGSWTFNIGTPNDGAIVYLGPAGTTTFTNGNTFSSFATVPNSSNPILYNSSFLSTGTVKSSATYDLSKNLYYPILIYYIQYSNDYDIQFSVTSPTGTLITDFISLIFNPLPKTPVLNTVTINSSTKRVEFYYTGSTYNGGYDISTNYAFFSTNSTMDPSFNVDIGKSDVSGNAIVTSLVYGSSYYVAMRSVNIIGYSSVSNVMGSYLIATVPVAPTLTSVTISSNKTVDINLIESTVDTGSTINYTYAYFSTSTSMDIVYDISVNIGRTSRYINKVDTLEFDVSYSVALKSVNAIGYSDYSEIKGPFRISNTSGAPYIRSITSGDGNLTVSFNTPNPGIGSTISGYQYAIDTEASYLPTNSFFGNATTTSFTIGKVENSLILGQTYTIFLRAVTTVPPNNALVFGSFSSKTAIPYTIPTAPSSVSLSIDLTDFTKINVTYTLVSNGGSAYTGYGYSINGGGYFDIATTTLGSFSIYGNYGSAYYVIVKLKNVAGFSDPSPQSNTVTLSNVPDAPVIYSATVGDVGGSILLTYDIPNGNGNPINNYDYYVYESTITPPLYPDYTLINSTNTSYRIIGLTNGTAYVVKLRARNITGPSLATTLASAVTPYTTPNAISTVTASVIQSSTTITVSWTTPTSNGRDITAYSYSINNGSYTEVTTYTNSFTIPNCTFGTSYIINVKVKNLAGYSNPTASAPVIPYTFPDAPTFSTSVGDKQISLLITAPDTKGRPITDYEYAIYLTSSPPGTDTFITTGGNGDITSFLITQISNQNLVNGTSYTIKLRARNLAGVGNSSSGTATPLPTPLAPTINSTSFGNGFITINFTPNAADASIITGSGVINYYEYNINGSTYISTGSTNTTLTITGLTNGTAYKIGLKAHSSIGSGIVAITDYIIPYTTPSAPIINTINLDNQTITLNITAPYNGGNAIKRYEYSTNGGSYISTGGTGTTITIPNLTNKATYIINLRAYNDAGYSTAATTSAAPYYASISGTVAASSMTLSGYLIDLSSYTTLSKYYINKFNKINDTTGIVSFINYSPDYVSLYASYIIASGTGFSINSDQRIKKNVAYLSSVKSLELVNAMKPCSFQYVDVMKGTGVKYGYLAQDVETVFPNLVYTNSEYIPNFYEMVKIVDSGKVVLESKTTEVLAIGTKLKFYDIHNTVILREVKEIIDVTSFTVTEVFQGTDTLFLYGQEVPNFRSIDAKQMTSVLLSALQEINKIIEDQDREIEELMRIAEDLRKELEDYISERKNGVTK